MRRAFISLSPRFTSQSVSLPLLLSVVLMGCAPVQMPPASLPASTHPEQVGLRLATVAQKTLGTPYRAGGETPIGFDCSGLVYFSYRHIGIEVPRTAAEQYRDARPVAVSDLRPGDLVFFKLNRRTVDHVGIYLGGERFIHAPQSGKSVAYGHLSLPYWRHRFISSGRFH